MSNTLVPANEQILRIRVCQSELQRLSDSTRCRNRRQRPPTSHPAAVSGRFSADYACSSAAWTGCPGILSICRRQAMDARWKWRNAVWTMQRLPRPGRNFLPFFHVLAALENWNQATGLTRLGRKMFLHFASCPFPPLLRWSCCARSRPDQISFELEFRILVD